MDYCTKCGNEIITWYAEEIWSGETRPILNKDPEQICNSCYYHCDGILSFADPDEMRKAGERAKAEFRHLAVDEMLGLLRQYGIPEDMIDDTH